MSERNARAPSWPDAGPAGLGCGYVGVRLFLVVSAFLISAGLLGACGSSEPESTPPASLDLAELGDTGVRRVYGSTGDGSLGLPVAGGQDVDGDGLLDVAFAAMQAPALDVPGAGEVFVVFGDGSVEGPIDSAIPSASVLHIQGGQPHEYAGSELWLDDVTGDGVGDVLIARQNYSLALGTPAERRAAGALSIVSGGSALRRASERLTPLALERPPDDVAVLTLVGSVAGGRLGIWVRSGDVTGDGIADLLIGADQEGTSAPDTGAAYLIAGGPHLHATASVDLGAAASSLSGYVARLTPPATPLPLGYHFGGTCQLADLDGNGRAEVLVAATLNRAGAVLDVDGGYLAHGSGGPTGGRLFIAWDDNFPALPWPSGFEFAIGNGAGSHTILSGSAGNVAFGEELLGGLDWDADGAADLFIGDLVGNLRGRPAGGISYVVYEARRLRGVEATLGELGSLAPPIRRSTIIGADTGDISGDTAAQGDFSGDGIADLVVCSPHHNSLSRHAAGMLHVLYGRAGGFPETIDLRNPPDGAKLDLLSVYGAHGTFGTDRGDTLCYSAATGDLDADGRTDLIVNEMVGNGLAPEAVDTGNLLILGPLLAGPSAASGLPLP
jgi:FG-GAP repeat